MSQTAHIPSHRKPRRSASKLSLRAGVAGGVLSTFAVAGAAGPANADPVTETIEMPTITADLSVAAAQAAAATQRVALDLELQAQHDELRAQEDAAAEKAAKAAKKAKEEADRKAEAEAKEEARKRAEAEAKERASRTAERTSLSSYSASGSSSSSGSAGSSASAGASSSSQQATGSVATVISFLKAQLGDAYIMGATGPNAWDCSSLVQAAFRQVGIELPRVSQAQSTAGTQVSLSNLQVGDILYWGAAGSAYHTGVYIGNGQYLDAANPGKGVVIQDLSGYPATGAVRVL
ncbi:C40 family peptidase [Streptomyces sp. PR69]|uniref:C40 family peptidase n=1 Tax=Streptomyces sp. PR69 TaxID=2984950 RepID=UPI002263D797|nr:C40 family peptidase [Streptomyces sp. PR69]